jgi:Flp pilus assembly pilin Flp
MNRFSKLKLRFAKLKAPRFLKDRRAIETGEVGVLLAVVVAVVYGAFQLLGVNISAIVTRVANFIGG